MLAELPTIPLVNLALAFVPVVLVLMLLARWSVEPGEAGYSLGRMLLQLVLIGYVLEGIFLSRSPWIIGLMLAVMLTIASFIALRTVSDRTYEQVRKAFLSIGAGGGATLFLVTQGVLSLDPWFEPQYVVPLAGMIFANSMNAVSLAAERFAAEREGGMSYVPARQIAMRASMIPGVNALLAVGLVSIPGMMTGQVLAGIDPLIAARYQIMVMAMVFGSAGLSAGFYLALMRPKAGE